jgi:hypothetical protein
MKLSKQELEWIKVNESMIENILFKRIDELKDELLELPEEKMSKAIEFLKEYKIGLGTLKNFCDNKKLEEDTGI